MAALCILAAALAPMQPAWRQAEPQLRVGREPVCMSRIPKAFRGGEEELREGSVWEGRVEEITASSPVARCVAKRADAPSSLRLRIVVPHRTRVATRRPDAAVASAPPGVWVLRVDG